MRETRHCRSKTYRRCSAWVATPCTRLRNRASLRRIVWVASCVSRAPMSSATSRRRKRAARQPRRAPFPLRPHLPRPFLSLCGGYSRDSSRRRSLRYFGWRHFGRHYRPCDFWQGFSLLAVYLGSYLALVDLYLGRADAAVVHLYDRNSNTYNIPYVQRLAPGMPVPSCASRAGRWALLCRRETRSAFIRGAASSRVARRW
mgnify:CR=1 FL=1